MSSKFDYFVIYAGMRTGSNFLESNIDEFDGLKCYGEAFNHSFIIKEKQTEMFGVTLADRDADPMGFVRTMRQSTEGLAGFRLFQDHDTRVIEETLNDPRCAKIILSRNLIDSWVSMRIAWSTNQWWLDDAKNKKKWKVKFNVKDFESYFYRAKAYQQRIARAMQLTGQAGYYIDYDDLQNLDVINGLARYLGVEQKIEKFAGKYKKQNPEMLADKVRNFDLLEETLSKIDRFDLGRMPNFEPKCGPLVPSYMAAENTPFLYMPVQGGPVGRVKTWLAEVNGTNEDGLLDGYTQKTLRQWKRRHPGHRSFTVLRHPVARLHAVFCERFFGDGPYVYKEIRTVLRDVYDVPLPEEGAEYSIKDHKTAFLKFADFIKGNLNGQTSVRVDSNWASQGRVIQGFSQFNLPDHILREDQLEEGLAALATEIGGSSPTLTATLPDTPYSLDEIYDDEVEKAVRAAYQRDYMLFGFGKYQPS